MIELPEALTIGKQLNNTLKNKTVTEVYPPTYLHKFAFFNEDPKNFRDLLVGKKVEYANGFGIFVDVRFSDNITLSFGDGINIRYGNQKSDVPNKYQLLITFSDDTFIVFTVAMYGGIYAYKGKLDNKYHILSKKSISPLTDDFNESYFENLISNETKDITVKALLATEQRIPGIGNGVLHDILFNAKIRPKCKISKLNDVKKKDLLHSIKDTLYNMAALGGRNTETDIFGNKGGYKSILSKNTYKYPCIKCDSTIVKEAYLGGTIYYCPECQQDSF